MIRKIFIAAIVSAALLIFLIPLTAFSTKGEATTATGSLTPDIYDSGEVMEFDIVEDVSSVEFIGKSFMHHFRGISHKVTGFTRVNFSAPQTSTVAEITVPVDTLKGNTLGSEKEKMSKSIHMSLESDKYPDIKFKVTQILPEKTDSADPATRSYLLKGDLTIHNVTKSVILTVNTDIKDGFLHLTGEYGNLNMEDYGVKAQSLMGIIRVNNIVDVEFDIYEDLKKDIPAQ